MRALLIALALAAGACCSAPKGAETSAPAPAPEPAPASAPELTPEQRAKLGNVQATDAAIARARAGEGSFSAYLKIDRGSAPATDDALRQALATAGYALQTVSGDVLTGQARATDLGALLSLPWVVQLQVPGMVSPP